MIDLAKVAQEEINKIFDEKATQYVQEAADKAIKDAIDDLFRYGGTLKNQIKECVQQNLSFDPETVKMEHLKAHMKSVVEETLNDFASKELRKNLAEYLEKNMKICSKPEIKFSEIMQEVEDGLETNAEGLERWCFHYHLEKDTGLRWLRFGYLEEGQTYNSRFDLQVGILINDDNEVRSVMGETDFGNVNRILFSLQANAVKLIIDLDYCPEYWTNED